MFGLQMYSVRDLAQTDLRGALAQVAGLGYQAVEFAGFFGHDAQTVKQWLAQYGLTVSGSHVGLQALRDDFDGVAAYHQALDCRLLIISYAKAETQADLDALVALLQEYQSRLSALGITLAYHNHAHEFLPVAGGQSMWDALVNRTSLPLEVDTYWVYAGGSDPLQWMETLHAQNRLPVIHIKDGLPDGTGKPLGMGAAPVDGVRAMAEQRGIPMVVESETLTPSGLEEARICLRYLQNVQPGTPA